jgi:hypothetical protein
VPPRSTILASSRAAIVTGDGLPVFQVHSFSSPPLVYMGCLRASGRERLLERFNSNSVNGAYFIASAVVAAPYAALVLDYVDPHYGGQSSTVQVFDLRTGSRQTQLGGESTNCRDESGTSSPSGPVRPGFWITSCSAATVCPLRIWRRSTRGRRRARDVLRRDRDGADLDSLGLEAVFCSTLPQCFITDSSGTVLTSTRPAAGVAAWTVSPRPHRSRPGHARQRPTASRSTVERIVS